MSINEKFSSASEMETEAFAAILAARLPPGSVVALYGNLGAGKTVFARGFARGLGIMESVSSPTYTIVQEYRIPGRERSWLYHLDLYRIADENSALGFGVDEFLDDGDSYALLEWPERISGILPPDLVKVTIVAVAEHRRELTVVG